MISPMSISRILFTIVALILLSGASARPAVKTDAPSSDCACANIAGGEANRPQVFTDVKKPPGGEGGLGSGVGAHT
jgi:hypothetical protein